MAGMIMRHLAWAAAVTAALSGCEEGAGPFARQGAPAGSPITGDAVTTETLDGAAAEGAAAEGAEAEAGAETAAATVVPRSGRTGPQDVEAPSVFQTTDTALWDGRPSLGGIWVAAPNVKDPERVIMRNAANGRSVEGALFRRERENPGPPLQISSDAAEALGLLAGQPAQITVTAVRRQEAPAEPPRRTATAARKTTQAAPAAAAASEAAAAPATAATAAAPAAASQAGAATQATEAEATTTAEATPDAPDAAAAPALSPREQRAAERKAAREARLAARAAAKAERDAARAARAAARSAAGAGGAAAGAPLSAIDPIAGAAAAIDRADAAAPAEAQAAPAAAPAAGNNVVQVATFGDEANATRTVATLTKAGLAAEIRKSTNAGATVYAVIARGAGTRAEFLAKVRGLGFKDAYVLSE